MLKQRLGRARGFLVGAAAIMAALLLWGAPPAAAQPADPAAPAYAGFFPRPMPQGKLPVSLVPHPRARSKVAMVSFGVPFPPGCVSDPDMIALLDNTGQEVPIKVTVLSRWLPPVPGAPCIRAALIQYQDFMAISRPRTYFVRWGSPRQKTWKENWPMKRAWIPSTDRAYPPLVTKDPTVWALFPPSWLGQTLIKSRLAPAGTAPAFQWLLRAHAGYYMQAANKPILTKRMQAKKDHLKLWGVDYLGKFEPWLFDRSTTIFLLYLLTGHLEPYRTALRDVQYYASQVQDSGNFALLPPGKAPNVLYGNQEALTIAWFLTGLPQFKETSAKVVKLLDAWDPTYSPKRSFWTERHLAYHLMIATAAYEMNGDPALLARARKAFEIAYNLQNNPPPGAPADGCFVHTGRQHSAPVKGWICSPWMSALLVDAALRYYLVSADPRFPKMVGMLADYLVKTACYKFQPRGSKEKLVVPHYLASSQAKMPIAFFTDIQHTLDTSKILALAMYFDRKQGKSHPEYLALYQELLKGAKGSMPKKSRVPGRITPYVLAPARKFSWLFRTTADMPWIMQQR